VPVGKDLPAQEQAFQQTDNLGCLLLKLLLNQNSEMVCDMEAVPLGMSAIVFMLASVKNKA